MNRRKFLQTTGGAGALSFAAGTGILSALGNSKAFAADVSGYKALVCVFLFGGQDCHDTVLPYDQTSYDAYATLRQSLIDDYAAQQGGNSRARANLLALNPVNSADFGTRQFALPPSMAALQTLFNSGNAAVVGNVGPLIRPLNRAQWEADLVETPKQLFSHNDQQSTWMSSAPEGEIRGWGGKFGDAVIAAGANQEDLFTAISTSGNTVFLSGETTKQYILQGDKPPEIDGLHNFDSGLLGTAADNPAAVQLLEDHYRSVGPQKSNLFEQDMANIVDRAFDLNNTFRAAQENAQPLTTVFPKSNLGNQLKSVANTINIRNALNVGRQVFFVSMGGFDTHDTQAASLNNLQARYAQAIGAFYQATVEMGIANQVTTFTASDFGRSLAINGDGTDHGWGSHHFVVGGAVAGNTIYGNLPEYIFDHDYDSGNGRLIPQTSVEQYAATLGKWYGLSDAELATALPNLANFTTKDLGFMGGSTV